MVGTQQGQAYTGKQGIQYATVLDSVKPTLLLMEGMKKKAAEKAEGAKQTLEFKPQEVWHYYSAEANKRFEEWAKEGGAIMTQKGIANLWTSNDPDAIAWQLKGAALKKGYDNINQAKKQWDLSIEDMRSATGKDYTDEYKSNIMNFATIHGYDQIASGNFNWPEPKFKEPTNIYQRFLINDSKVLKEELGDTPPSENQLLERTINYFSVPEHSADLKAISQSFNQLSDDWKKRYENEAEKAGYDKKNAPLFMAKESYREQFYYQTPDLNAVAVDYADKAPLDVTKRSTEDVQGVTEATMSERLGNKEYPMQQAVSHFTTKPFLLDDDKAMIQLGVDPTLSREEKYKQAVTNFAKRIEENIATKYEKSLSREGSGWGGFSQQEQELDSSNWYADVTSGDQRLSRQAANWLAGTKDAQGNVIVEAEVIAQPLACYTGGMVVGGLPTGVDQQKAVPALYIKYGTPEEKQRALKSLYATKPPDVTKFETEIKSYNDEISKIEKSATSGQITEAQRKQKVLILESQIKAAEAQKGVAEQKYNQLIETYQTQATGNAVYVPLVAENIQIAKLIHGNTAKARNEGYKVGYNAEERYNAPGTGVKSVPWSGPESFKNMNPAPGSANNPTK